MGNKGDAEKMKVMITEERYRHEAKFAEPESNLSNHNFAIAVSARRVGVWLCLWLSPVSQSTKVHLLAPCIPFPFFCFFLRAFLNNGNLGTLVFYDHHVQ